MLLHLLQKLDDDLGAGSDQDLSSTTLFRVGNCFQAIGQNRHSHHLEGEGQKWEVSDKRGDQQPTSVFQRDANAISVSASIKVPCGGNRDKYPSGTTHLEIGGLGALNKDRTTTIQSMKSQSTGEPMEPHTRKQREGAMRVARYYRITRLWGIVVLFGSQCEQHEKQRDAAHRGLSSRHSHLSSVSQWDHAPS